MTELSIPYKLIRSDRRTLSLQVSNDLQVIVRAPRNLKISVIEVFINKHIQWIKKQTEKIQNKEITERIVTPQEEDKLKKEAKRILPERTKYFAELMGVIPFSVKITSAKKRFGSCSSKNGICFSWRLMNYPEEAIDYVVVHELAHIKHKNHSKEFYSYIKKYLPDYKDRIKLLKN